MHLSIPVCSLSNQHKSIQALFHSIPLISSSYRRLKLSLSLSLSLCVQVVLVSFTTICGGK